VDASDATPPSTALALAPPQLQSSGKITAAAKTRTIRNLPARRRMSPSSIIPHGTLARASVVRQHRRHTPVYSVDRGFTL
jgi:hypothetical protein